MRYSCLVILLALLIVGCGTGEEEKSVSPPTAQQTQALEAYLEEGFVYTDTLILYDFIGEQLVLDFGDTKEKSWVVAVIWKKENKEVCTTKIGLSYRLDENNKLQLDLPEEYFNHKQEELELSLVAIPRKTSYISNWDKYESQLTSFMYEDVGQNSLRPIREHWLQMLHITHKVNMVEFDEYPYETLEFLVNKEQEIIKGLKFIKPY